MLNRLLIGYFVCTLLAAAGAALLYGEKLVEDLRQRAGIRAYRQKTREGREHFSYDSGTIGDLGGVVKYDWTVRPDPKQSQRDLREMVMEAFGVRLDYARDPKVEFEAQQTLPGGVTRILGSVDAEAGYRIKVCLLLPDSTTPLPTVVLAYGLGGSIFHTSGYGIDDYHHDMGFQLAKAGYNTVTYEMRGLGPHAADWGDRSWRRMVYDDLVGYTLLRGSCAMNVWVFDGIQVVQAVTQLAQVDATRIGFAGISHGGQVAMYAAAMAPDRIRAAVAMGSFLSFEDLYTHVHNFTGHAIPGIAKIADMGDLAALVAPRPLLIQWGELERNTWHGPLREGSLREFSRAKEVYARFGANDQIQSYVSPEVGHGFDVEKAVSFLSEHL